MGMTTTDTRALDARVAELVMGWERWVPPSLAPCARLLEPGTVAVDGDGWRKDPDAPLHALTSVPAYTTSPAHDYEVLHHVRETWLHDEQYRFAKLLMSMWRERGRTVADAPMMRYLPGDYARAALAVVEGE